MAYCEYMHEPKYGMCGLSDKYGECMRCENIESDVCERMRKMAREEEGGGEMTDTEVIEYLMDSDTPKTVKQRCIWMLRAQRYGKIVVHNGKEYCECGNPVEIMLDGITLKPIGGQIYCDQCGAKLDWSEFMEKGE